MSRQRASALALHSLLAFHAVAASARNSGIFDLAKGSASQRKLTEIPKDIGKVRRQIVCCLGPFTGVHMSQRKAYAIGRGA
jgi:hypothetical protein